MKILFLVILHLLEPASDLPAGDAPTYKTHPLLPGKGTLVQFENEER